MDVSNLPPPEERATRVVAAGERSIGALLVDGGKLSSAGAEAVLRHARTHGLRFGDAAVALGMATPTDVQHALAMQFDYPYLAADDASISKEAVAAFAPFSPPVEALRALRTQLMLRWFGTEPAHRALAVVSPARREGRSYVAANLAVVFSQLGERTLLVDADLRAPRQHEIFGLGDRVGLSALLSGRAGDGAIQRIDRLLALSVLPAGATPPNPQELLGRPAFGLLLEELAMRFDVILLDTPAAEVGADLQAVAAVARGVMLVTRRNATRVGAALELTAELRGAGASVVGAVLNDH